MKAALKIMIRLIPVVWSLQSQAQVYGGSVSAATGGTGRAAVVAGDSVFLNPATLPYLRGYYFYTMLGTKEMAVGLSDNTPESPIPAALSYYRADLLQDFKLSLADFIIRKWTVGVSAHYYQVSQAEKPLININGDLAFAYAPKPNYGFGAIFYNLVGESKNFPEAYKTYPRIGLGTNYIYHEFFRMRFDLLSAQNNDFRVPTVMLGLENYLSRWMLLRFGYRDENAVDKEYATLGFGFDLPRFKLNYAYEGDTKESANSRHSIDLAVPF